MSTDNNDLHEEMAARAGADGYTVAAEGAVLQLRFKDRDNSLSVLNAKHVAETLEGLVELTSEMAKEGLFGEDVAPELVARPAAEGSFIVEVLLALPDIAAGVQAAATGVGDAAVAVSDAVEDRPATAAGVASFAVMAARKMRSVAKMRTDPIERTVEEPDGRFKVYYRNGDERYMTAEELATEKDLKPRAKKRYRGAVTKIMAPISGRADEVELRDGEASQSTEEISQSAPHAVLTREDYREIVKPTPVEEPNEEVYTVHSVQFRRLDFDDPSQWSLKLPQGPRRITVQDPDFLRKLSRGYKVGQNDLYDVEIRETTIPRGNRRAKKLYEAITITLRTKGGDGDDDTP